MVLVPILHSSGDTEMESWKAIPSSPKYEVSDMGRVRHGHHLLHIRKRKTGYLLTTLGSKRSTAYIHRLVAEAFIGPVPEGKEVNHKNLDKADNRPENLEYVTHQQNQRHAMDNGALKPPSNSSKCKGEKQWCSKLSVIDVVSIRILAKCKMRKTALARMYGVNVRQIFKIINREQWSHI
jgi:hypothetical protein